MQSVKLSVTTIGFDQVLHYIQLTVIRSTFTQNLKINNDGLPYIPTSGFVCYPSISVNRDDKRSQEPIGQLHETV